MAKQATDPKKAALGVIAAGGALAAVKVGWDHLSPNDDPRRYHLYEDEPASEGLRRIALGQLDAAIDMLEGATDEGFAAAVHEARKSLKRTRAVVRLARFELGEESYRCENAALRQAGRGLADVREGRVLLDTFDALNARRPDAAARARASLDRAGLETEYAASRRALQHGTGLADTLALLRDARSRVEQWPLHDDLAALAPGFGRMYRRARRAHRRARRDPTSANLHELRKRTKDVRYAAQVLRASEPKLMRRLARGANELSDLLGEDHDLATLAERDASQALDDLIERRRAKLRPDALRMAKRLFRAKPRKVEARFAAASARS